MEIKVKRRAIIWLISAVLSLSLAGLSGWTIKHQRDYQNTPAEHLIGNKAANVNALKEKGFPFSFLVVGDTQSREMGETLIKLALKQGDDSFMVLVGDFVKDPDIWSHRFFITEMTTEINPPFPVFLVPGNHDIDYTSTKIKEDDRRVTPEVYESLYGARNFDFVFNQCLFILLDLDLRNPTSYLEYLRHTLSQKGEGKKYIFTFIHFPPKMVPEDAGPLLPNEDEFFSLLEAYKVKACFFGHYHGYWRGQRNGVNLIVVGGGGGRLKSWQSEWGKFHHILKVSVGQDIIVEEMITLQERFSLEDWFEERVFIQLLPAFQKFAWMFYVLTFLFLSWGIASLFLFVHSFRNKKTGENEES